MEISIEKKNGWNIIYPAGRLDIHISQQLEDTVEKVIGQKETKIIFNLENVEYLSSSGLRVFISTMRKLKDLKGEMRICSISETVAKIFRIVELESMFKIFPDETAAIS
ncbi:MAG: hypothetical protein A2096_10970 [Spirochaetes bacterium GWF1_41_5]|nr:MAG: hypothetical protein A2096_10970 [Spirochaetes bacterium GWF1_41_5]HBE01738.1 anti-sigma factor antagonist [Spirochaetia bacterium]